MTHVVTFYDCKSYLQRRGFQIDDLPPPARTIAVAAIQSAVSEYYQIPVRIMTDGSRYRAHTRPRQVAIYLARQFTIQSLPQLGRRFGNRDHTTIMHAVRRIEFLRFTDRALARDLSELTAQMEAA